MDIMIDIETFSTKPNALIVSIAGIKFDPFGNDEGAVVNGVIKMNTFYRKIDPESYTYEPDIDQDTLDWWAKQDPAIIDETFDERNMVPVQQVLRDFYKWSNVFDRVWANGSAFDTVIIESACRGLQRGWPWKYWQVRDYRTVFKLVDVEQPQFAKHHPLWDCWSQVVGLQRTLQKLKITEFPDKK